MSSPEPAEQAPRLLYQVSEAAAMLSLSRAKVYELINSGASVGAYRRGSPDQGR